MALRLIAGLVWFLFTSWHGMVPPYTQEGPKIIFFARLFGVTNKVASELFLETLGAEKLV